MTTKKVLPILLIGNYPPDGQKSMNAYAETLHRGIIAVNKQAIIIRPGRVLLQDLISNLSLRKWIAYIDKYIIFSIYIYFKSFRYEQICICDHSNSIYVFFTGRRKTIVICHDVIAIQAARGMIDGWQVGQTGRVLQSLILSGLRAAKNIICVSQLTQNDLLKLAPELWSKAFVISNPQNYPYSPTQNWREILYHSKISKTVLDTFIIHVGSDLPRKNRLFVLRTLVELMKLDKSVAYKVVFVGPQPNAEMTAFIQFHSILDQVNFISDINSEELQALYTGALLMLFPSFNEGFGWPVIEAQACGCPVFASNVQPMPEVGGNAATYIDPKDAVAAATTILNADLNNMKKLGLENAKRFELPEMVSQFIRVINS